LYYLLSKVSELSNTSKEKGRKPSPTITNHHPNRHPQQANRQIVISKGDGLTVFWGKTLEIKEYFVAR